MQFTKEAVVNVQPAASLLAASLASRPSQPDAATAAASGPLSVSRRGASSSGDGAGEAASERKHSEGYTVAQVVSAILEAYNRQFGVDVVGAAGAGAPQPADRFALLVAEDDGTTADPDFPEIDPSVAITSIGVDKFVLLDRRTAGAGGAGASSGGGSDGGAGSGGDGVIVLRVTIPTASIALRACESGGTGAPELAVTCYVPPTAAGASATPTTTTTAHGMPRSFQVVLTGGGKATAQPGLAAPSAQALHLLDGAAGGTAAAADKAVA